MMEGIWENGKIIEKTYTSSARKPTSKPEPKSNKQPKKDASSKGAMERLSKLKKLFESRLINKSDYEKKKNEILNDL